MQAAYLHRGAPVSMREPTLLEPFYAINRLSKLVEVVDHVNKTFPKCFALLYYNTVSGLDWLGFEKGEYYFNISTR